MIAKGKKLMALLLAAIMLMMNVLTAVAADEDVLSETEKPYPLTVEVTGEGTVEVTGEGVVKSETVAGEYMVNQDSELNIIIQPGEGYEKTEILLNGNAVGETFRMPAEESVLKVTMLQTVVQADDKVIEDSTETEITEKPSGSEDTEKMLLQPELDMQENLKSTETDSGNELEIEKKRADIKSRYFSFGRSARNIVNLSTGRVISYDGYSTNYFTVEGNTAYCLEPAISTPASGSYSARVIDNNSDLARALWYSVDGPGSGKLYQWYGSEGYWQIPDPWINGVQPYDDRYSYSHMFLSWVYSGFDWDTAFYGTTIPSQSWYEMLQSDFESKLNNIRTMNAPPSGFSAYVIDTGSGSQVMGGWSYIPDGCLQIEKSSALPEITMNNSCYSLEGAEYSVYRDSGCTDYVGTMQTNADGSVNSGALPTGDYWVKETKAPKGYALDQTVHQITVNAGQTTTLNVKDYPQSDPVAILLGKIDAETNSDKPSGSYSLANAEFTVKYYGEISDTDPALAGKTPIRQWVLKTNEKGRCYLSNDFKISGDDFYYMSNGDVTLPLGTITIQETKAPIGYLLNNEVFVRQITPTGDVEIVETYNAPTVPETPQKGKISLEKVDGETGKNEPQGTGTLKGAKYDIFLKSAYAAGDTTSSASYKGTLTTDEKGKALSGELALDTYYVIERQASAGYLIDPEVHEVKLTAENTTDKVFVKNIKVKETPQKGQILLEKTDSETGKNDPQGAADLSGAKYDIFLKSSYVAGDTTSSASYKGTLTTDEKGKAKSEELPLDTYYVIERQPSNGYLVDQDIHEVKLTAANTTDRVFTKTVKSKENIIRGDVEIIKLRENEDADNDTLQGIEGVEFTFTSDTTGKVVKVITTDKNGYATTKDPAHPRGSLVFDTYTVTETKCPAGLKPIEPFKVTISEEGVTLKGIYKEDKLIVSPVTVVKVDAETGKNIPAANTEFRLLDENKKPITMVTYYPDKVVHETFKTNENGQFTFPEKLKYGTYYLEELNAPEGYLKGELLKFEVTEGATWEKPLVIEYADKNAKGKIKVIKTDAETGKKLPEGAEFDIIAEEDIVTPEGTLRVKAGDTADHLVTGKDSAATSKELYLGKYIVKETKAPEGYLLNEKEFKVTLSYADQNTELVYEDVTVPDAPAKGKIRILKTDAETGKPIKGAEFEVTAAEDIVTPDGTVRAKAGDVVDKLISDKEGKDETEALYLGKYIVKETKAPEGYLQNKKEFEVTLSYADQNTDLVYEDVTVKDEHAKGKIKILKTDAETDEPLKNAEFDVIAAEDIVTPDGTIRVKEGEAADHLITGEDGTAETKALYLGKYTVKETKQPDGYIRPDAAWDVELKYKDQNTELVLEELEVENKPTEIRLKKTDAESGEALPGITFKIWNKDMASGDVDQEMAVASEYITDKNGEIVIKRLAPGTYCIQEVKSMPGYAWDDTIHEITIDKTGRVDGADVGIVTVENDRTEITETNVIDTETDSQVIYPKKVKAVDTVSIKNLKPGVTYVLKSELRNVMNGLPCREGNSLTDDLLQWEHEFTATKSKMDIEVDVFFDAENFAGQTVVVFEKLYQDGVEISTHTDLKDVKQQLTIKNPKLGTTAIDVASGTHEAIAKKDVKIRDNVQYEDIIPGTYTLKGVVMEQRTGKPLLIDGKTVTAEKEVTITEAKGTVDMDFMLDASELKNSSVVIYEYLYYDEMPVAAHEDINDKNQTITFKEEKQQTDVPKTGDDLELIIRIFLMSISIIIIFVFAGKYKQRR